MFDKDQKQSSPLSCDSSYIIYGHCSHLGHVTCIIRICIGSPFLQMFNITFGFDWTSGFRGEDV